MSRDQSPRWGIWLAAALALACVVAAAVIGAGG